jgi:hypothetical protein
MLSKIPVTKAQLETTVHPINQNWNHLPMGLEVVKVHSETHTYTGFRLMNICIGVIAGHKNRASTSGSQNVLSTNLSL